MKLEKHFSNFKLLILLFLVFFNSSHILGQKTSTGSTDWNTASTWNPVGVPTTTDNVIIRAGDIVTVNASPPTRVASITFNNASALPSGLNIAAGVTLTTGPGPVTQLNAATTSTNASISGMGTLTCGTLDIGTPVTIATNGPSQNTLNLNIKTINVANAITLNNSDYGGGASSQPVLNINSGCTLSAFLITFTHVRADGAGGAQGQDSINYLQVNSGGTLTLCNFPPIIIDYRIKLNRNIATNPPQINVDFLSGSTVNLIGVSAIALIPQNIVNSGTGGTTSPLVINYSGTTNVSASRVAISTPSTTICSGNNVTFTATPTAGGSTPSYQWKINGTNTGTNSPLNSTFTSSTLNNNDSVTVVMTTNNSCPQTATSNAIVLTVNPSPVSPTVGTVSMPSCEAIFGSLNLSNLPATGTWSLTQSGTSSSTATGSGTTTTVSGLVTGSYTYTVSGTNGCVSPPTSSVVITGNSTTYNGTSWSNGEPDLTKIAVFDGDYTSSSNLSACGVIVNAGKTVTFTNLNVLTVKNEVTVNGSLTFENNTSLVQINNVANSGNITYKRTASGINGYDFVYWSSPVLGQNIETLYTSPISGPKYAWNPIATNLNSPTSSGNWEVTAASMTNAKGFIVRGSSTYGMPATAITSNFIGVPNNGNISIAVNKGTNTSADYTGLNGTIVTNLDDNWNLIGNPYPSSISCKDFLNANSSVLTGALYVWTHGSAPVPTNVNSFYNSFNYNYSANDYNEINLTGNLSGVGTDYYLGAGQSFFVTMRNDASSNTVNFTNALRNSNYGNSTGTNFFRVNNASNNEVTNETNRIWIDLIKDELSTTRTMVGYVAGATNELDNLYDARVKRENSLKLFSLLSTEKLSIQGKSLPFDKEDEIPLGIDIITPGDYKIAIAMVDGLFDDPLQNIYLEDSQLGIVLNLRTAPYTFTSEAGNFNNRFKILFSNSTLSNPNFENDINSVIVLNNSNEFTIKSSLKNLDQITIYDLLGRQLYFESGINKNNISLSNVTLNNQTLIVKIKLENGIIVTKKIAQ